MFWCRFSEYYFSKDNLERDYFLRCKMDKDGWIAFSLIASFHRIRALTQNVSLIMQVVYSFIVYSFNPITILKLDEANFKNPSNVPEFYVLLKYPQIFFILFHLMFFNVLETDFRFIFTISFPDIVAFTNILTKVVVS